MLHDVTLFMVFRKYSSLVVVRFLRPTLGSPGWICTLVQGTHVEKSEGGEVYIRHFVLVCQAYPNRRRGYAL